MPATRAATRQPGRTDAGTEIDDAVAGPRWRRRRQQHRVMTGAMAALRLLQAKLARRERRPR